MKKELTPEHRLAVLERRLKAQTRIAMAVLDANVLATLPEQIVLELGNRALTVEPFQDGTPGRHNKEGVAIRLKGQWLRKLGFEAGQTVRLTAPSPGILEIRRQENAEPSKEFQITAMRLDHAIEADEARKGKTT